MVKTYIDPGHGGTDPGASGNGIKEKDITLKIAKKVREYLGEYDGVSVKMSRTGDTFPTLTQRTNEVNAWGADLFLSIHINAGGGKGYEDFVYTTIADNSKTGKIRDHIHTEVMKKNGLSDRGKKKANLHVLRETKMPAVLTENGFIDNADDAKKMKSQAWIDDVARGHVNGIAKAFDLKKKSGGGGSKPKPTPSNGGSGKYGQLKIVNVSNAAIVMDKPDRVNANNIGTVAKGSKWPLNGSVRGKNSSSGYWEIEFKGRLGYITGNYGERV
ncbi:N-acetylmuramoyl-L-alanine amidase [Virgibacillus dakarensis]|nr:N-acetylmuramoyl-L-alanine amidase [Virgibacillus dakarensis]